MAKVNLTIGESKSKVDLSLEGKNSDLTWAEADWSWGEDDSPWSNPKITSIKESKSKVDLSLENK